MKSPSESSDNNRKAGLGVTPRPQPSRRNVLWRRQGMLRLSFRSKCLISPPSCPPPCIRHTASFSTHSPAHPSARPLSLSPPFSPPLIAAINTIKLRRPYLAPFFNPNSLLTPILFPFLAPKQRVISRPASGSVRAPGLWALGPYLRPWAVLGAIAASRACCCLFQARSRRARHWPTKFFDGGMERSMT